MVFGVIGGFAAPASAHATLESTNPPSGAVLRSSPGKVVLHFDQQVEASFGSIRVYDSSAKRVDSGDASHPRGDSHSVQISVPGSLPDGGYVVTWRVISADSHPVHGAFTFSVGGVASAGIKTEASQLLARSGGSNVVGGLFGAIRFAAFASVAILLGGALFAVAIWPETRADRRARRLLWWALGILVVATTVGFGLPRESEG
jgi:copper transport protein